MMRYHRLALCLLLLLPAVSAEAMDASAFDGVYLGAGVGYMHEAVTASGGNINVTANAYTPSNTEMNAGIASVFVGYGQVIGNHFYWGQELFANYLGNHTAQTTLGGFPFSYQLSNNFGYNYGVAITPGYVITPNVLWYGRLAVGNQTYYLSAPYTQNNGSAATANFTTSGHVAFLGVGTGVTYQVMSHVDMRLQYEHDFYQTFSLYPPPGAADNYSAKDTVQSGADVVTLALSYKF